MAPQPPHLLITLLAFLTFSPLPVAAQQQLNPALPLRSSSRWILDANNTRIKFRCVNWAGHQETNHPEGLDKQSIEAIVNWIAANGFNCVRLTYSIDHALQPDILSKDSFTTKASSDAGVSLDAMNTLYSNLLSKNPRFADPSTTVRDVYAAVIDTLWSVGIFTILDNHVSHASWCCNLTDGNGWWDQAAGYNSFNSRYFNTTEWVTGLSSMATWARDHPGVVAMSLRNELRAVLFQDNNGRADWYKFIKMGGDAVAAANDQVLIVVGGSQSSTDLSHLRAGAMLDTSNWAGRNVWEMHAYSFSVPFIDPFGNCNLVKARYGLLSGFVLEQGKGYTGPLILSEFGVGMEGGSEDGLVPQDSRYLKCLVDYMTNNDAEWAVWALQGSYYIRDGTVDSDETWGLMNHDWSGWRNADFPGMLGKMWDVTQDP